MADRWRWRQKQKARRSARALAQILLGERMRTAGVQYTPELEHLEVERGDGTLPCHYAFQLHDLMFATGPGESLVVFLRDENRGYYKVWSIVELGRAVKALGARR